VQQQFETYDCSKPRSGVDDAKNYLVTCNQEGSAKYILGPAALVGTDVKGASSGLAQNSQGQVVAGDWQVNLDFTGRGTKAFSEITTRVVNLPEPQNRVAIVLDGAVISDPRINEPITGGSAQITGGFTQTTAAGLASNLRYGALPLAFDAGEELQISPTLGSSQLRAGLIAGLLGLGLVVLYSLAYYRGLGLVTVFSLIVAGIVAYASVVLLGNWLGFRLSLAGVAGLIVAIGITADSFVVYFERLRDEVRDGRTLRVAAEAGWVRARRTILAADFVSLLAAVVLYILSVGSVKGFAFTLGLTTLIDIVIVFLFTKPLVSLLAGTAFFNSGSPWSGLARDRLGASTKSEAKPVSRRRAAAATATAKEA
jgi:preprotein translocase subunit SecD